MTASDLSAITKPWPEQKRVGLTKCTSYFISQSFRAHHNLNLTLPSKQIANLVAMEFFAQGDKEKEELNIKPIVSLASSSLSFDYI